MVVQQVNRVLVRRYIVSIFFLFCMICHHNAMAVTSIEPLSTHSISKVFLALVFILALIFVTAWLLKRFNYGQHLGHADMKILASMPLGLGTKEKIAILKVGDTYLLLGVAPGSITRLHEFTNCPIELTQTIKPTKTFLELLKKHERHEK